MWDQCQIDFVKVQRLESHEAFYLLNGHAVGHAGPDIEGSVRIYGPDGRFLAIGAVQPDGQVAPKRLFVTREQAPKEG